MTEKSVHIFDFALKNPRSRFSKTKICTLLCEEGRHRLSTVQASSRQCPSESQGQAPCFPGFRVVGFEQDLEARSTRQETRHSQVRAVATREAQPGARHRRVHTVKVCKPHSLHVKNAYNTHVISNAGKPQNRAKNKSAMVSPILHGRGPHASCRAARQLRNEAGGGLATPHSGTTTRQSGPFASSRNAFAARFNRIRRAWPDPQCL